MKIWVIYEGIKSPLGSNYYEIQLEFLPGLLPRVGDKILLRGFISDKEASKLAELNPRLNIWVFHVTRIEWNHITPKGKVVPTIWAK